MCPVIFIDAQLALEAGQTAMAGQRWDDAVEALEQAITLDSRCTKAAALLLDIVAAAKDPILSRRILPQVSEFLANLNESHCSQRHAKPGPIDGVYQFRLTLRDSDPEIWRRVQLGGRCTLVKLHHVIQRLMHWQGAHLHEFATEDGMLFGQPNLEEDLKYGVTINNERHAMLYRMFNAPGQQLEYRYDFRDGWEIDLVLEEILTPETSGPLPVCLDGRRAGPPEEIGGVAGYRDFLEVRDKPWHPDFPLYAKRFAGFSDPEAFDLMAVNQALARL